jgi:predicted PurR-regulated permease PerM
VTTARASRTETPRVPAQDERARNQPTQVVVAPRTLVTFVAVSLAAAFLVALVYAARGIVIQLLVAVVLAMALEPFVQLLERRGIGRGRAVGITFAVAALAVAAFGYVLIPPLVHEVASFSRHAPDLLQTLTQGHGKLGFFERRFQVVEHARAWIAENGGAGLVARPALHAASGALSTGAAVVAVAFLTLFVGLGGRTWFDAFLEVVPEGSRERWRSAGTGISKAVGGYVTGNLLISLVAGCVTTVILLATHVPYPVPLGLVVAVFDLIPLVGATLGTVVVAAAALTKGVPTTVIVVAGMVVYQQIENNTLQPLVYHRTVQLSPLAIAVSVAAGAEVGGIVGALLGIPIAGAIQVASREIFAARRGEDPPQERPKAASSRSRLAAGHSSNRS